MYFNGTGVPRNVVEGCAWTMLAAAAGNKVARQNLAIVRNRGLATPQQLQQGATRAAALRKEIDQRKAKPTTPPPTPKMGGGMLPNSRHQAASMELVNESGAWRIQDF